MSAPPAPFENPGHTIEQKIFFELAEIRRILTRLESLVTPTYRVTPDGQLTPISTQAWPQALGVSVDEAPPTATPKPARARAKKS